MQVLADANVQETKSNLQGQKLPTNIVFHNETKRYITSFLSLFFFLLCPFYSSASPWGGSLNHRLHLPIFLQGNHPQVRRILQHHLRYQISCNWPCLVLPCLFSDISSKFSIIIFRPAIFEHTTLGKFNCSSCNLWPSRFDAGSR